MSPLQIATRAILAYNPNHGPDGRFASATGVTTKDEDRFRFKTSDLAVKSKPLDIAVSKLLGKPHGFRHTTWIDKKTGYKYDFRPKGGMSARRIVPAFVGTKGELQETRKSGWKTIIDAPDYKALRNNCQDAQKWLAEYVEKFKGHRRGKEVRVETVKKEKSETVAAMAVGISLLLAMRS